MQTGYAVPWLLVITVMLCLSVRPVAAEEPFRVVTPAGSTRHPAVLIVPRCSGFVAANGLNLYEERAPELRAVGHVVVFVDYVGRRMQMNCAHVSLSEVAADMLEAATRTRDQSGVDAARISVIGWSYGGGGVLAALKCHAYGPTDYKGSDVLSRLPGSGAVDHEHHWIDAAGRDR